jgi:hypothetical protein
MSQIAPGDEGESDARGPWNEGGNGKVIEFQEQRVNGGKPSKGQKEEIPGKTKKSD